MVPAVPISSSSPTSSSPSHVPTAAPMYAYEGSVPSGPLSRVFRARHISSNKLVIVKTYLKRDLLRHGASAHALSERATLAAVHGVSGAAQLLHATHDASSLTLVLLRAPGIPAASLGAQKVYRAASIARSLTETLREIHARDVVHRDLALRNVLVDERDTVTIVDFGAAALRGAEGPPVSLQVAPPEALVSETLAPPADIWGLGTALYSLLTGNPVPFRTLEEIEAYAATPKDIICVHDVRDQSCSVKEREFAVDFVRKCLHSKPERRIGCVMAKRETDKEVDGDVDVDMDALWNVDYEEILKHEFLQMGRRRESGKEQFEQVPIRGEL